MIGKYRYRYADERALHDAVETVLQDHELTPLREVRLTQRDRIDLLIDRVGIEIKIDGSAADVERQLRRYVESDLVDELVLVTNRAARHARLAGDRLGKPITIVDVARGDL